MTSDHAEDRPIVLSLLPAGRAQQRAAAGVVLVSLAVFLATAPFARLALPKVAAFVPAYETALFITDLITAALLFGQFAIARTPALLALAGSYLFTASMTVVHALTFPGVVTSTGLFGAGPQTTAWLYMGWHAGFPLGVMAYARLERPRVQAPRTQPAVLIALTVAAVLGVVGVLAAVATLGQAHLPVIMHGNRYAPLMIYVVGVVWSLSGLAIATLWRRRPRTVLDLWLMVVLCAWLCDVALGAVLNARRFDLGFYVGRAFGISAASFVLVVLLMEAIALYARLANTLAAEKAERELRMVELRSELIHVSRLSELGQMVSALAHEVNQPLTALGNYLSAGRRLVASGELNKAQDALGLATEAAGRAGKTIRRLRDFVRRDEGEKRSEDLGLVIEEAIALAVAAAERKGAHVDLRVPPEARAAFVDRILVQQVLLNLIRNAIEAAPAADRPRLIVATTGAGAAEIEVSVTDFGPGLPAEVRAKLFQPFVTTKANGMGVGLSICRSIIEAHGGRMWAEDNPVGGAVFRFTVPRDEAA